MATRATPSWPPPPAPVVVGMQAGAGSGERAAGGGERWRRALDPSARLRRPRTGPRRRCSVGAGPGMRRPEPMRSRALARAAPSSVDPAGRYQARPGRPCPRRGCPPRWGSGAAPTPQTCDFLLDPFAGSGTTCLLAKTHGRDYLGIDLNPTSLALAQRRLGALPACVRPA